MTDYVWPASVIPSSASIDWLSNDVAFYSPLSGTTRTETRPGGRWAMTLTVMDLKSKTGINDPLHELEAFLYRINGKEHRIVCRDFGYSRSGPATGSNPPTIVPSVFGAGQTGKILVTNGWAINTTVLFAGDRVGISNQMIPVTQDVTSDASGFASLVLAHPIRIAPANQDPLELDAPTARFILKNNVSFGVKGGLFKTVMVELEESIL